MTNSGRRTQIHSKSPGLQEEFVCQAEGLEPVAGLDEAGRGAWAGPVVAGCVVLPLDRFDLANALSPVRDSKTLSAPQRDQAAQQIRKVAVELGVGQASAREVDELGLIQATRLAMQRALAQLRDPPAYLLIDHLKLSNVDTPQKAITRGDRNVLSIAAASILAKVHRDRIMLDLDRRFPHYGFAQHKGYGTRAHRQALLEMGPSPIHRKSFAPIAGLITSEIQT